MRVRVDDNGMEGEARLARLAVFGDAPLPSTS